jgi:hypothetical protein
VYDYYLGGSHNFAVDRRMARQAIERWPDLPLIMRANRAFLRRSVRYLISQGIRQFLQADLRDTTMIFEDPRVRRLLDLSQLVGVLMVAMLHFIPDEADPATIVALYRKMMPPGSYLIISHATHEGRPDQAGAHTELDRHAGAPLTMRSRREIAALLEGFDLVPPGMGFMPLWRPDSPVDVDDHPERFTGYALVGRRR